MTKPPHLSPFTDNTEQIAENANCSPDTARDGLVLLRNWLADGPGYYSDHPADYAIRQAVEALLARIETPEAQHAEDVKRIADAKRILSMWHGEATEHIKYGGGVANAWLTKPIEHTADWLARNPPSPRGTFACPICGKDTPHRHDSEDVKRNGELEAALQKHHDWHLAQTDEADHGIIPAEAYADSGLCDATLAALNKGSK